jgi:tetratricopeptide (TPR) repeat protein
MKQDDEGSELKKLRKAVLEEPRNAELRYLLAAEMAQAQDYEGAVLEFSAAIALNPMLHVARLQLGLLHLTLGQPHHTTAVLAPLEDLGDDDAIKHFKRGLEALIADAFESCLANLQRGIELNRSNAPLNRDMQLIIDRVHAFLAERARTKATAPDAPTEEAEPRVRTDFSLYNETTKH